MNGILRYGAYIPYFRLTRKEIAAAWGSRGETGERAVAAHDEDSITMAVEACRDCLAGLDRSRVDGLFFVSTTSPYREKQAASLIASVLGLRPDILTADFSHCLRSGLTAMELARNRTMAGIARSILVVFSDARTAYPGSSLEAWFGDAAAAFLLGQGEAAAVWESFHSLSHEMMDVWRTQEDRFVQCWEDRWAKQHGLLEVVSENTRQVFQKAGWGPGEVQRVVLPAADPRTHRQLARQLGFNLERQVADPLLEKVGFSGAAHVPLVLALALEQASPGERLLASAYGDGADSLVLRTTAHLASARGRRSVSGHLDRKAVLPGYLRYLRTRGLVEAQPPTPLLVGSSATILWRERKQINSLVGCRCRKCGEPAYPIQRICLQCRSKDDYDEIPLAECQGKLFTFTLDHLASQVGPPLIQSVVDLEPGCRVYTTMTDADPQEVQPDMEVEMTFRRSRKAEGFYNYFWKCRPVRQGVCHGHD